MRAIRSGAQADKFRGIADEGRDSPRRRKDHDVRNGSRSGRTAERAILEVRMTLRVLMVRVMSRRGNRIGGRTKLQQKRGAAGRHEANRYVGAKQQRSQQYDGPRVGSPTIARPVSHSLCATMPEGRPLHQ